jgi:hypothetical protein
MSKLFDEITEKYESYDELVKAFKAMPKDHEDYLSYKQLIAWCNKRH